ncbi:FadR/GntR family transcriptional regulator [Mesorhizobium sp. INR15]|uniref:FadR/GntR family transcriptional regulator n=1 Tax=Mesorhizobium sp. INR15 TaxID=2654248 RepID=UPI001896A1C2|nr:FCD domain-containing protein [Mesorhizobium sp. INR15]QPC91988.1 FCD domain-containing protein [Mesorhizobium sp. INR15]
MLSRVPVPHAAARKIQGMILSGELRSGEKMPSQREFALSLGVSRASLREALLTLETLGLLKTEPGRGTFVSQEMPSASRNMARWRYADSYPVADVFETRIMLEGRIAGLSSRTLTEAEFQALELETDTMERNWETGDLLANAEADLEFHAIIASACPNRMIVDLYQSVRDQLTQTQIQPIPITEPARMKASIAEHRRIIRALRMRDAGKATQEMQGHIRNTARCAGILLAAEILDVE